MTDQLIKNWQEANRAMSEAYSWNDLPNTRGRTIGQDKFAISIAHCKAPSFQRCGQHTTGGQNYWESPKALDRAVLQWLVDNWQKVWPEVFQMLKDDEAKALIACQEYVDQMQGLINSARRSVEPNEPF